VARTIPYLLVWFRLLLAPGFWIGYALGIDERIFAVMLVAGIVSDIYDGVLARRWGTSTPTLRRFDSNTDSIFYGCAGLVGVFLHAAFLAPWRTGLLVMFAFQIAQNLIHGFRYRQQPSYHMWSGKLWSIALVVALISLFLGTPSAWAVDAVVALGIFNCVEASIASLILSKPLTDINTLYHAILIARAERRN
jgi:CDP-diacylglycerol--glycerol-3-phosphate 3-phosphatidyltransferase